MGEQENEFYQSEVERYQHLNEIIYGYHDSQSTESNEVIDEEVNREISELLTMSEYGKICLQKGWQIPEHCSYETLFKAINELAKKNNLVINDEPRAEGEDEQESENK